MGLKRHYEEILEESPQPGWFEKVNRTIDDAFTKASAWVLACVVEEWSKESGDQFLIEINRKLGCDNVVTYSKDTLKQNHTRSRQRRLAEICRAVDQETPDVHGKGQGDGFLSLMEQIVGANYLTRRSLDNEELQEVLKELDNGYLFGLDENAAKWLALMTDSLLT